MGAEGSQASIAYTEEIEWGVMPVEQFQYVNFTGESLGFVTENQTSNNIRPDRQTSDLIQTGASCEGGIDTEFQAGNIDDFLIGFLFDTVWHDIGVTSDTLTFTEETSVGEGGIIGMSDTSSLSLGQWFRVVGSVDNDGTHKVVDIIDGITIRVDSALVDESAVSVTLSGSYIRNGVTRHSYSIERTNNDISQFFLYVGMVPNVIEFKIESGSPITASLSFVGKEETLSQTEWGTGEPLPASVEPIINAVSSIGSIDIDGEPIEACLLQSASISVDNQTEGKTGIGVLGYCNASAKSLSVTGALSMYFNDHKYYEKYLKSNAFSMSFEFGDKNGNTYIIDMPQCKFDSASANVSGRDDDVIMDGSYVAIVHPVYGYTIQITKF